MIDFGDRVSQPTQNSVGLFNKLNLVLLVSYVVLLVGGLVGLDQLRNWALQTYDTSFAQESWTEWREETERQSKGEGPVTRRKAKSHEPPALVLARDYYSTLTVIFMLLGSVLFATIALMLRGALSSTGRLPGDVKRCAVSRTRSERN